MCNTWLVWYNEKFVYYSNSPRFYAIYFLGKKLFWCYTMYNWDAKIPGKEKKTIIVRNTNLVWLFILFIEATTTTFPLVTLPPPSPPHFSVDHGQHAGHRSELYASLLYYFTARYARPHDQCGEWNYSDFRGEISYFTHELYAQNCIKY